MKTILLPAGEAIPAFGLGTWRMGENLASRAEESATIRLALDRGVTLFDTAEMYGEGAAEELIGESIAGRRDSVFLVSKVYPHHACGQALRLACEASLRRLRTDRLDLYLLHWRGQVPLEETLAGFGELQRTGKIRHYGVSNLDLADLQELWAAPGGQGLQTNQLLYNLSRRGVEWDILPWLRERHLPVMAYSPIEQARLLRDRKLVDFARLQAMTPAQAALAWLLAKPEVLVIPKTGRRERLKENLGALEHPLTREQVAELDQLFPPPSGPSSLEML
jgi:diketogulonate reductase-like aldo/keto reductase